MPVTRAAAHETPRKPQLIFVIKSKGAAPAAPERDPLYLGSLALSPPLPVNTHEQLDKVLSALAQKKANQ